MNSRRLLPLLCTAFALAAHGQEAPAPTKPAAPALRQPAGDAPIEPPAAAPAPAPAPARAATPGKADPALDLMPAQPGQLTPPPPAPGDLELIPDSAPPASKPKAEKKSKTEIVEEELAERIRLRQAQTRAQADPAVQAEWENAQRAHTDYEKREGLKRYYALLYARIRKIDPKVKKLAAEREAYSIRKLTQSRLAPTEPTDAAGRSTSGTLSAEIFDATNF